ncbi:MAG TPA: nitronate monooxygenase, partial [Blastocatellia bacterium]|nr:nitronate monooxygenase [Blastocatellia bacterium]
MESRGQTTKAFRLLGCTPPGLLDPAIAIATSRAGGVGILNLECARDEHAARAAVAKLARYGGSDCGIKLDANAEAMWDGLIRQLPEPIKVVILTATDVDRLPAQVHALHQHGLQVLLEVNDLEQADAGAAAGVDGLIAKGNEAAGWVGEETTLILLQRLLAHTGLPVLAQGGVGLHTAAACYVAGAAGLVLDAQLWLARESSLPETTRRHIARMDGSETVCLAAGRDRAFRTYARPGMKAIEEMQGLAHELAGTASAETARRWRQQIHARIGWDSLDRQLWPLGQDAGFAASLSAQFHTAGGII